MSFKGVNMKKKDKEKKKKIFFEDIYFIVVIALFIIVLILLLAYKSRCPIGYRTIDGACAKIDRTGPTVTKYCPDDYKLEKDKCVKTLTATPTITYYCDNSYEKRDSIEMSSSTLSGTTCSYTLTHEPTKKKSCPPGAVPYSDTQCKATIITDAPSKTDILTGRLFHYCVGDQIKDGNTCIKYEYSDYIYQDICMDDFKLENGKCIKDYTYEAGWKADCPDGYTYEDKKECKKTITSKVTYNYECPSGYKLKDKVCQKVIYLNKQ